ncbi:MAG: SDR family oxidoreductase [Kofleriaceae bacterium]|nr:SDR family oxidoreductase [Myxococcales bacterium]MCB9574576.1 SDR family oxidoreductase [Kofleriaceae bacterium]
MTPGLDLAGKVVVVTGALGLIGGALTRGLAAAGAAVVVTDLDHAGCVAAAAALPGDALGHGADITDPAALEALRDAILRRHDRLDGLVNNAAIDDRFAESDAAEASRFERYDLARWRRSLDVNVTGTFLACQVLGAPMAARGAGAIVNVASTYGLVAPDQALYRRPDGTQAFFKGPAYPTGKAAVLGLTRYLASYWGHAGVRVNALCPGGVANGQAPHFVEAYQARTPLGRMARPDDYVGAAVFLIGDGSAYMTGANLVVDGGWTAW